MEKENIVEDKKNKENKVKIEKIINNSKNDEIDENAQKDIKINELVNDIKRLGAEFENYRKRTQKENNEFKELASANLISDLLPVLDSLEMGIKHNKEFVSVYEQVYSILKKNGLEKMHVNVGDEFDHNKMDCLMQESVKDLDEGVVAQVLSTGYMLKGKILRTVKISINKKDESIKEKTENEIDDEKSKLNSDINKKNEMEEN